MKKTMYAITAFLALSSQAFAASSIPVLIKNGDAGYTRPEYYFQKLCSIYLDKVVKTSKFGDLGVLVSEERAISLEPSVLTLIEQAKAGPFTQEIGPTDIPMTGIFAFLPIEGAQPERITLYSKGSGGSTTNENPASTTLRNIVDELCE
jgi:hypothetical protein